MTASVSPEVIDKWRSDFEIAAKEKYPKIEFGIYESGSYWTAWIDHLWVGFKMARESAVIELPKAENHDLYSDDENDFSVGIKCGLHAARKAIESQGYQVNTF